MRVLNSISGSIAALFAAGLVAAAQTSRSSSVPREFQDTVAVLEKEIVQLQEMLDQVHAAHQEESDRKIAATEKLAEARRENDDLKRALLDRDDRLYQLQQELEGCRMALKEAEWVRDTLAARSTEVIEEQIAEANHKLSLGQPDDAARLFSQVLNAEAGRDDARLGLAVCRYTQRRLAEAKKIVEDLLAQNPRHAPALGLRGIIAYRENDLRLADRHISRALTLTPDDPQLHNYMGIVAHARGKPDVAAGHFRRAVQLAPDFAEAQYNLARVLVTLPMANLDEARRHYDLAVRLGRARDASMERVLAR
ncbi:MAG: tetratricopeptide repeat protein [Kiritimatiellae bacterium]|nr:tetratricopeptide repeat protein [Kiritimatiellia bacterium]